MVFQCNAKHPKITGSAQKQHSFFTEINTVCKPRPIGLHEARSDGARKQMTVSGANSRADGKFRRPALWTLEKLSMECYSTYYQQKQRNSSYETERGNTKPESSQGNGISEDHAVPTAVRHQIARDSDDYEVDCNRPNHCLSRFAETSGRRLDPHRTFPRHIQDGTNERR